MKLVRPVSYAVLVLILGGCLFPTLSHHLGLWQRFNWVHEPFHSAIEAFGALAALVAAVVLFHRGPVEEGTALFPVAMGLLGMGLLDGLHAIASPGQAFVFLHSTSGLVGGLGFAAVWLPAANRGPYRSRRALWLVVGGSALFGLCALLLPDALPPMVHTGSFTSSAVTINGLGGVLFLIAALRFLLDFHRSDRVEPYLFVCLCLLLGMAGLTFRYSTLWDDEWWLWHMFRLVAFLLALWLASRGYMQMVSDLRISLAERKQVEGRLKASEAQYQDLYDNAPDMFCSVDAKTGNVVQCNQTLCAATGYTKAEIIGRPIFEMYHPDGLTEAKAAFQSFVATGEVHNAELQLRRKNGNRIDVTLNVSAVRDSEGNVLRSRSVWRDITRLKQAEEDLREGEQRFRSTFEQAAVGIAHVGPDGRWLRVNQKLCDIVGYAREELLERTFQDITHPDDLDADLEYVRQVLADEIRTYSMEKRYFRKDGATVWIDLTVSLVREPSGEPLYFIAVVEDIAQRKQAEDEIRRLNEELEQRIIARTAELADANQQLKKEIEERKQVEAALRKSEALYRAVVEDQTELICRFTSDGMLTFVNEAYCRYSAKTRKQLLGHQFILLASAEDQAVAAQSIASLSPENPVVAHEHRVITPDGDIRWHHWTKRAIHDAQGDLAEFQAVGLDITDRKEREVQIRELNAALQRNIKELQAVNQELESFSYSVSHDLRAPIRAIDGFTEVLLEEHADQLDDEARRVLGIVIDSTRDMGNLIDDLLAFSRLSRREMRRSTVDMTQLARDVSEQLQQGVPDQEFSLNIEALPSARCDRGLIREVFANLLANAIKFSGEREGAVIEVTGRAEGREAIYSVKDNGVGFNMDYADKLFEAFQRLHSVEEFEGAGIGLALVQRIIHRHDGRVWGEGRPGKGATFHFSLPLEKESEDAG